MTHFLIFFFLNRRFSLLSFWLPQRILIYNINLEALPITYSVCCVSRISWQTLQPITLCYFVLGKSLSFTWTAANGFEHGTRGKLHHTQTPPLTTRLSGPSFVLFLTFICTIYTVPFYLKILFSELKSWKLLCFFLTHWIRRRCRFSLRGLWTFWVLLARSWCGGRSKIVRVYF